MDEKVIGSGTPPASPLASPVELATLATLIDPAACGGGNCRDALFRAIALLEESAAMCNEMKKRSSEEWTELIVAEFRSGSKGAGRLLELLSRRSLNAQRRSLTLALRDDEKDSLRPYLEEGCNFKGKTGRKAWSRVRTVLDNLRCWWISRANEHNTTNAGSIKARETRDAEDAQTRGCSVEELQMRGYGYYECERWHDAVPEFDEFLAGQEVLKNGKVSGHSFPSELIDMFMGWKRWIRTQKGGMSAVRPLTRDEIFAGPVKKGVPTKVK